MKLDKWESTLRPQLPKSLIEALRSCTEAGLSVDQIAAGLYLFAGADVMAQRLPPDVLVDKARRMHDAMTEILE